MKKTKIVGALVAFVVLAAVIATNAVQNEQVTTSVTKSTTSKSNATRAEVAQMLATTVSTATDEDLSEYEDCAPDVKAGDKYENAICFLVEKGIFLPFSDEKFKPKNAVTREEAAQLFYVAYDYLVGLEVLEDAANSDLCRKANDCMYKDVQEDEGLSYAIAIVTDLGIVDGKPWTKGARFNASKPLTKAAAKVWGENFEYLVNPPEVESI